MPTNDSATQDVMMRAYESCTLGKEAPTAAVVSGVVLNARSRVRKYDDNAAYLITPSGIVKLNDEEP